MEEIQDKDFRQFLQKKSYQLYMKPYRTRIILLTLIFVFELAFYPTFPDFLQWFIGGCVLVTGIVFGYNIYLYGRAFYRFRHAKPYMKEMFSGKLDADGLPPKNVSDTFSAFIPKF